MHDRRSQREVFHSRRRRRRTSKRLAEFRRPEAGIPELEVVALADHHRFALELRVLPERRRQEDAAGRVRRDVLLETKQQALPPARLRMEARKGFDLRPHRAPSARWIDEDATIGMGGEDK